MPALNEEDLYHPFIAEDGLEYEDFAAFLCGQPQDTWRNQRIQDHRKAGRSEAALQQWIKGYDGDDPRTTGELEGARAGDGVRRASKEEGERRKQALDSFSFRFA